MASQAARAIPAGSTASDAAVGVIEGASRSLEHHPSSLASCRRGSMFMSTDIIVSGDGQSLFRFAHELDNFHREIH
jgi:hypothetical protein